MSQVQETEDIVNQECNNIAGDDDDGDDNFGLGPEKTRELSPKPFSELPPKVNFRPRRNTFRPINGGIVSGSNHRQALTQSQHTEIEFYSSESGADDEDDGNSFCDSDDNSSGPNFADPDLNARYDFLQCASSRQSFQSIASDAFTLPVGSQDDVSSLESDNVGNKTNHDSIDDISLEEEKSSNHGTSVKPLLAPVDVVDTFESPRRDRPSLTDPARLQALRDSFSKKNQISALHMSFTSRSGLDQLPATLEEEENDDNDEKSVKIHDLLAQMSLGQGSDEDDAAIPTTLRLHNSLFLPRDNSSFFMPFDICSPIGTPKSRQPSKLTSWNKSLSVDDISFDLLAKTLPPELDLIEARKYIVQLSRGVMEIPPNDTSDPGKPPQSAAKSSGIESEYTEVIVEDDDDDHLLPLSPAFYSTPQSKRTITNRSNARESFLSYDYSEVVEEEVIEDDVVEEVVIEEMETEVIYEEEVESDGSFAAKPAAVATMVNNSG